MRSMSLGRRPVAAAKPRIVGVAGFEPTTPTRLKPIERNRKISTYLNKSQCITSFILLRCFDVFESDWILSVTNLSQISPMPKPRSSKSATTTTGVTLRIRHGKKGSALVLDIVDRGRRTREHLGLYLTGNRDRDRETLLLAEQLKAKRLRERALRRAGIEDMQPRPEEDFLSFFDSLAADRGKPWRNVRHHLSAYVSGRPRFGDINEAWIEGFRRYLDSCTLKTNSVATYLDVLKTAFNIAVRRRIITTNPFVFSGPIKRVRTHREYLTLDELRLLHNQPCQHEMVKRSFLFACLTGLRISDLRRLSWRNVLAAEVRIIQQKTGDHLTIPLSQQALSLLPVRSSVNPDESVFAFPSRDDVYNSRLQRWVRAAGIEKHVTSHVARHTFATLLVTEGNDLYLVQHLLGHRDIKVTQTYAKMVDNRKVKAINSLPTL